jgi:hypothetical protein
MTSGDVFEIVGERMYLVNGPRRLGLGITQCDANSFLKWWRGNYTMKDVPDNVSVQRLLGKIEEFCLCWRIKDEDYSHRYLKEAGHQFACSCITFYTQLVCPATAYLENVFATSSATGRVGLSTNIRDPRPVYQGKNTNWQKKNRRRVPNASVMQMWNCVLADLGLEIDQLCPIIAFVSTLRPKTLNNLNRLRGSVPAVGRLLKIDQIMAIVKGTNYFEEIVRLRRNLDVNDILRGHNAMRNQERWNTQRRIVDIPAGSLLYDVRAHDPYPPGVDVLGEEGDCQSFFFQ